MIIVVCFILVTALCCVMLSYVPWIQEHMQWMTSFKFFIAIGAIVGFGLLLLSVRAGEIIVKTYGS